MKNISLLLAYLLAGMGTIHSAQANEQARKPLEEEVNRLNETQATIEEKIKNHTKKPDLEGME